MKNILQIQLTILLIVTVGYAITKMGLLSVKTRTDLTNLVIYIVLPCNIFNSFSKDISAEVLRQCGVVLLVSFGMQFMYILLNKALYLHLKPQRRIVARYATICNNAGFLGLPVIETVFGQTGMLYGSIVLIPLRIFMWTAGLSLFTKTDTREKLKSLITHPCILAVIFGFAYIFVPFTLPKFISGALSALGGCTTALSMVTLPLIAAVLTI